MTTTTRKPVLNVVSLTKSYGDATVVDGLSLTVERGEIFGILGANGAGKTTSVECAQGLRRPDAGTVRVLGLDPIVDRVALAGRVGSQLQHANLPDTLRVGEAIRLFADDRTQADRVMADWQLDELVKVPFGGLSGGQKQRLFLALALLNDPEIVFLDELTQGLDPSARRSVWALIERIRARGTTVVLVTHFMDEAELLCDRVAVMRRGRLVAQGSPAELIDRHGGGVRVRLPGTPADLDWLRALPGVTAACAVGHEVEVSGPATVIAEVGAAGLARGRGPLPMRVDQPDLETALMSVLATPTDTAAPVGAAA